LKRGRRSDFPRFKPRAISLAETGSVLTCRKRNRFSGLRLEVRGIRWLDAGYRLQATETILLKFFSRGAKLFLERWGFIGRTTHDWLVTLRQTSWFSPRGECEEAGRPGPPPLFFHCFFKHIREIIFAAYREHAAKMPRSYHGHLKSYPHPSGNYWKCKCPISTRGKCRA